MDVSCFGEGKKSNTELRGRTRIEAIRDIMRDCRLTGHGHVQCKGDDDWFEPRTKLLDDGIASVSMLRNTWQNTVSADMCLLGIDPRDVQDRVKCRAARV